MTNFGDVVLLDINLNKLSSLALDYYTKGSINTFSLKLFNNSTLDIIDLRLATSTIFSGIVQVRMITGGGYEDITSDWATTANLGALVIGQTIDISLKIFISGGSSLDGLQTMPLYISKG